MSDKKHIIPVWFFVGVLLLGYGIIILISGLLNWSSPPNNVVLTELHAPVWWGGVLIILGAIYTLKFRPGRS
jgi:hypothetical protein